MNVDLDPTAWVYEAGDEAACFMLHKDQQPVPIIARFTVLGEPQSKSRPRVTRNGTYTPENVKKAEAMVGWAFKIVAPRHVPNDTDRFGVFLLFFSGTRQRRDVDNMSKVVLDGLTGLAWVDDSQVVELSARKGFVDDKDHARIEAVVYLAHSAPPLQWFKPCEVCGKPMRTYASSQRRFCSPECRSIGVGTRHHVCVQCGASFQRRASDTRPLYCSMACKSSAGRVDHPCAVCGSVISARKSAVTRDGHVFCGPICRQAYWRPRRAVKQRGICSTCGGPTSKKTYIQCAPCRNGTSRSKKENP